MEDLDESLSHSAIGHIAFPKIKGRTSSLRAAMATMKEEGKLPPSVVMEGTIKLHGQHADIVFDLSHGKEETSHSTNTARNLHPGEKCPDLKGITFQSRNRICTPDSNMAGWPRKIAKLPSALIYIRDTVIARFRKLNPGIELNTTMPLIIAGEWIGQGVQKNVGVSKLDPGFVIISININGEWQRDSDYAMIEANKAFVYSIYNIAPYAVHFDTTDLTKANPAFLEMQRLADEVEAECPFAAHFGHSRSPGEGIVWKLGTQEGRRDPQCWVKTKGPTSGGPFRLTQEDIAGSIHKDTEIATLAKAWITNRRIEQGFEYLLEMGITDIKEGQKSFCKWMVADILKEEQEEVDRLKAVGILDAYRQVRSKVNQRAHDIYYQKMKSPD